MKIRSSYTDKKWLTPKPAAPSASDPEDGLDKAREQINRVLSEVVRCQNLVILTGLGTSLCVMNDETPPKPKAPTMLGLWNRVREKYDPNPDEKKWGELLASVKHQPDSKNIEELLSACKVATVWFLDSDLTNLQSFIDLAEKEIREGVDFLEASDELSTHAIFLQRIARRSAGKNRAKLFTTNYDLCFERAAKDGAFVVIDGFSPTLPPTFNPVYFTYDIVKRGSEGDASAFIPNVFHLYKLHGSIDWERRESGDIEKKHETDTPLLIYPRSSKYEQAFSQPYLEMMAALQSALREQNTGLLVIGFGFNDKHIAEPILSAIRSNLGLKVVVVDPW
ncbi:MAG: SIR2 family protein, partial [Methyloglobulus sp.]|nr:SIR2 family protein [Methyloglobulus sp.]